MAKQPTKHVAMFDFDPIQIKAILSELKTSGGHEGEDHDKFCPLCQMIDALEKNEAVNMEFASWCRAIVVMIDPVGEFLQRIGAPDAVSDNDRGKAVLLSILLGIKIGRMQAMNDGHVFSE